MNRDDIIRMARDVELFATTSVLIKFAALVAAAEREACAKVCEVGTGEPIQMKALEMLRQERERIAIAIRARGNNDV